MASMNDWVASYLVKESFLLTALEFYQELKETGQEQLLLSKLFKHREYTDDNFVKKQKETDIGLPPVLGASDENTKLLQQQIQKKDEKINVLQYEIRILKSDIEKLKQQLSEAYQKSHISKPKLKREKSIDSPTIIVTPNNGGGVGLADILGNDHVNDFSHQQSLMDIHHGTQSNEGSAGKEEDDDDGLKPSNLHPISQQEKQVVNYMIKNFLVDNDYKITAISFSDEVNDTDMISLDDMWSGVEQDQDLNLLYLYRYYYKGSNQSKQRMKDTKALRDALSSIEQKNKMIKTYEQSLLTQEQKIDAIEEENKKLKSMIADLQSGRTEGTKSPRDPPKKEYTAVLLPREGTKQITKSEPHEVVPKEISILQAKLRDYQDRDKSVIHLVGQKLPVLVRSVKSNKREEFMPIICLCLQLHPEYDVRNKLAALLFNLIKKPDESQRETIMDGCVSLARKISPEQFESELLPQCWEQIYHKYPERRILVADACGQLAGYVSNALRTSLLLSMMGQLAADKVEEVRMSVAKNLALLIQTFEDIDASKDKYGQVEEMMLQLLYDRSYNVVKIAKEVVAPAILKWTAGFNYVFDKFIATLLKQMENIASKKLDKNDRDVDKLLLLLETFKLLIPLMYNVVIDTMPDELEVDVPKRKENNQKEKFDFFWSKYDKQKSQSVIDKWPAIKWISEIGLERFVGIIVSTDVGLKAVTDLCDQIMQDFCLKFGRKYTSKIVQPLFLSYLSKDNESLNKRQIILSKTPVNNPSYLVKERLLPAYIAGVLATCDSSTMSEFIREIVTGVGVQERGWSHEHIPIIETSLSLGCKVGGELMEEILTVLWNLCVHPSKSVRLIVVNLFKVLMNALDSVTISNRLVTALVTMSSDPEKSVRVGAIHGLGALATNISSDSDFDKLNMHFETFFNSPDREIFYEALRTYSQIIPKVEQYFRDQYVLKKLVKLGSENNLNANQEDRRKVAALLFDCYRALNGCVLTRDNVSKYILNGLEMLERDCELLSESIRKQVSDMIKDLRYGLDPTSAQPATGPNATTTGNQPATGVKKFFTFGL